MGQVPNHFFIPQSGSPLGFFQDGWHNLVTAGGIYNPPLQYFNLTFIWALRAISTCVNPCNNVMRSEVLHKCISERQILILGTRDWILGRVAATPYQILTGGMPPMPPALTKALVLISLDDLQNPLISFP